MKEMPGPEWAKGPAAVDLTRSGLTLALEHGLTGPAAEIYQRLADALEHTGDYAAAKETYDEAFSFCAANALQPTAQLCLACLTAVLRQTGDWERAVTLCRQVIASGRCDAACQCCRYGHTRLDSRLSRADQTSSAIAARIPDNVPAASSWPRMELLSTWGLRHRRRSRRKPGVGGEPVLVDRGALEADGRSSLRDLCRSVGQPHSSLLRATKRWGANLRRGTGRDCHRLRSGRVDVSVVACAGRDSAVGRQRGTGGRTFHPGAGAARGRRRSFRSRRVPTPRRSCPRPYSVGGRRLSSS